MSSVGFSKFTRLRSLPVADRTMILRRMQDALASMTAAPYGSVQWLKKDLEFHTAIVCATGNAYIVQFIGFVSEKVRDSILVAGGSHASDEMARATLSEHEMILVAVRAGDPAAAQEAMRVHLDNAAARAGVYAGDRGAPSKLMGAGSGTRRRLRCLSPL